MRLKKTSDHLVGNKILEAANLPSGVDRPGIASYRLVSESIPDRRKSQRRRVHLRSGKLIDREGGFLSDCRVADLGKGGVALVLPAAITLPGALRFYDDCDGMMQEARIAWRENGALGLALTARVPAKGRRESRWGASLYAFKG